MVAPILAQLPAVDPTHLRDFTVLVLVFGSLAITAGSFIVHLLNSKKAQRREVSFTEQLVTKEFCMAQHDGNVRRLTAVELEIARVWETMRTEDEATRQEVRKCFQDIERALGRIEGELHALRPKE